MPEAEHSYPLTKIQGREYLEVKYRIHWLRKEHPEAAIETTIHSIDSTHAVVTARVSIPGGGVATGSAMEEAGRFPFLEKAETAAIGRALGALGYGTLECLDFDETLSDDNAKPAESPVERRPLVAGPSRAQAIAPRAPASQPATAQTFAAACQGIWPDLPKEDFEAKVRHAFSVPFEEKITNWGTRIGWEKAMAEAEAYKRWIAENPGTERVVVMAQ